jgi:hypothetical protein
MADIGHIGPSKFIGGADAHQSIGPVSGKAQALQDFRKLRKKGLKRVVELSAGWERFSSRAASLTLLQV